MKPKHVIFDCDGVLVDSEPLSMRSDVMILRDYGITMSESEAHRRFVGKTFQAMLDEMEEEFGVVIPPETTHRKDRIVEDLFRTDLKIVKGVIPLLTGLQESGITMSIASNSPKARVELAVDLTRIAQFFGDITTKEEVPNGKPAPDVYLRAVEKSRHAGAHCVAVEDSTTGVAASVAAGLMTLGFTGTDHDPKEHAERLKAAGAHHIINDMHEALSMIA